MRRTDAEHVVGDRAERVFRNDPHEFGPILRHSPIENVVDCSACQADVVG